METSIKVNTEKESSTERENTLGPMGQFLKEISSKVWDMVMELGNQLLKMETFT